MRAWFVFVFSIFIIMFMANMFLMGACYISKNPNDIACYMISERYEVGVRQR
jgi:hypothetical protein